MITTIAYGAIGIYTFLVCMLLYYLFGGILLRKRESRPSIQDSEEPFMSIILPAHNEAHSIKTLLESLLNQDYNADRFEIIVIDDRSTDETVTAANTFAQSFKHFKLISIKPNELQSSALLGKQNALHQGILASKGDYIVQADADCTLSSDCLAQYAKAFKQGADLAFSWTQISPCTTVFQRLQAVDLSFLFSVAAATAKLGRPLSCMGNNIGFSKQAYLDLGGYPVLGASPVEDYQLLTAFRRHNYKIRFIHSKNSLVQTAPVSNIKTFLFQHIRWARGALTVNPLLNLLTTAVLLINTGLLIIPWFWPDIAELPVAIVIVFKLFLDATFVGMGAKAFAQKIAITDIVIWEFYYILSPVIYLVMMCITPRTKWH